MFRVMSACVNSSPVTAFSRNRLHTPLNARRSDRPSDAHFLLRAERLKTMKQMHVWLKADAPLVVVHHSFPNEGPNQNKWPQRNAAFAVVSGMPSEHVDNILALKGRLPVLSPEQYAVLLSEAGFTDIELFYCAFTFEDWVACRP